MASISSIMDQYLPSLKTGTMDPEKVLPEMLDKIINDVNKLLDLSKKIPEMISVIEKLEERVAKERADGKGKGGKDVNRFQFPKNKR